MPAWLKVLLAIGCGFVLMLIIIGAAGIYFFRSHKDQWLAEAKKVDEEGRAYAAGRTANDCIDESLRRLRVHSGFMDEVRIRTFLNGCLDASAESPQLCEGVPPQSEILRTAQWSIGECARRGMPRNQPCTRVHEVQKYCERPRR